MRLVCPNCDAKYEVPEDAIPETGRDVQCANCGHAWYQMRPRAPGAEVAPAAVIPAETVAKAAAPDPVPVPTPEPEVAAAPVVVEETPAAEAPPEMVTGPVADEPAAEAGPGEAGGIGEPISEAAETVVAAEVSEPEVTPLSEVADAASQDEADQLSHASDDGMPEAVMPEAVVEPSPPLEPEPTAAPEAEVVVPPDETVAQADDDPDEADALAAAPAAAAAASTAAYAVDDSVLAILREEADREAQARRAEAKPLEVQAELGVDTAIPPINAVGADLAGMDTESADASSKPSARRDLLPDVEEINSTLRPGEEAAEADQTAEAGVAAVEGRSSFRSGFLLVMTIAILGAALYIAAPMLRDQVPALAGLLDAYIGFVDGLRLQLDGLMRSATTAMGGEAG